jgi:hypothetical protein
MIAMKKVLDGGLFIDLTAQEMAELNGGSTAGVLIAKAFGFVIGAIAKIQEYSGDNGQWMA